MVTARRTSRPRSATRAAALGRGGGLSSSWPPGSKEGEAALTKPASNPAASTAGSAGLGRAVSVTEISSTSAPTRPGCRAGANICSTVVFRSMPQGSPAPAAQPSVLVPNLVLNLYRRSAGRDTYPYGGAAGSAGRPARGTGVPAG